MPTLEWIGKSKVVNHHLDVPYRVLDRVYSFDADGQHEADIPISWFRHSLARSCWWK